MCSMIRCLFDDTDVNLTLASAVPPTIDIGDEACNLLESKGRVVFRRDEVLGVTASDNMNHGTALTMAQAVDQRLK